MDAGPVQGVRAPRGIAGNREAGCPERGQVVSRRDRTRDGLRPSVHVDPELAAKIHRGGMRVDMASGADVHRIAFREDPRVAAVVGLADVEEKVLRIEKGDVLAPEAVLVRSDSFEVSDEARLACDETRGSVSADQDARLDGLPVRLDPPAAVVTSNARDLRRCAELRPVVHGAVDKPPIECRAADRITREPGDVEPGPVRHDARRAGHALRDPLIPRMQPVRREAELAHALRALDRFPDDFLLLEDRGPESCSGERPCGHSTGGPGAPDDRIVHSGMGRGRGYFGLTRGPRRGTAPPGPPPAPSARTPRGGRPPPP